MEKPELRRTQVIALVVASGTGVLALVLYTLARKGPRLLTDPTIYNQQLSAVGGIFTALLLNTVITAKRWCFSFAVLGMLIGVAGPWLYRILEEGLWRELAYNFEPPAAAAFAFGTTFLVKSTGTE